MWEGSDIHATLVNMSTKTFVSLLEGNSTDTGHRWNLLVSMCWAPVFEHTLLIKGYAFGCTHTLSVCVKVNFELYKLLLQFNLVLLFVSLCLSVFVVFQDRVVWNGSWPGVVGFYLSFFESWCVSCQIFWSWISLTREMQNLEWRGGRETVVTQLNSITLFLYACVA